MTPVDVREELRTARPVADAALHARVQAIARQEPARRANPFARLTAGWRRGALIAVPAAAVLAVATAGAIGFARSGETDADRLAARDATTTSGAEMSADASASAKTAPPPAEQEAAGAGGSRMVVPAPAGSAVAPTTDRAQRFSATLTLEVSDTDELSDATQRALRIARDLGGFAANVSFASAESGTSTMTLRIPTGRVQDAITRLSELGTIVGQQVQVDDLQEGLDELDARIGALREQIARLTARLGSESLDPEIRATLEARRSTARAELAELTRDRASTRQVASLATIQLALQTDEEGIVAPAPTGFDRALDVLAWEAMALLFLLVVAGPFVAVAIVAWLGTRALRRRGDTRLLGAYVDRGSGFGPTPCVQRRDQRLRDDLERAPGDLARLAQAREGFLLGQPLAVHRRGPWPARSPSVRRGPRTGTRLPPAARRARRAGHGRWRSPAGGRSRETASRGIRRPRPPPRE